MKPYLEALEVRNLLSTYYVAPWGSDAADGLSPETPWASHARANVFDFEVGDELRYFGDEFYPGRLVLGPEDSGLTVGSYGAGIGRAELGGLTADDVSGLTVRDLFFIGAGKFSEDRAGLVLRANQPGVLVDGLFVYNVEAFGYRDSCCEVGGTASGAGFRDARIESCTFYEAGRQGFYSYSEPWTVPTHQNLTLTNCLAYNCTIFGFAISGVQGGTVSGCVSHTIGHDYFFATAGGPVGLMLYTCNGVLVSGCESFNVSNGLATYDGDGMGVDVGTTNCTFENNYSHDNEGPGFYAYSWDAGLGTNGNAFRNNLAVNNAFSSGSEGSFAAAGYIDGLLFEGNVTMGAAPPLVLGQVTAAPVNVVSAGNSWEGA